MEFTKGKKRKLKQWANAFYKAHKQISVQEKDYCQNCQRGGELKWIDNKEVINQLMDELFIILSKKEDGLPPTDESVGIRPTIL